MISEERIIGIDYGDKRIGIAITDPLSMFAYPLDTLINDKNFWENFNKLISKFVIKKIVLGFPYKDDGKRWEVTDRIEKFAEELKKRIKVDVIFMDERYTSVMAKDRVIESVTKRSKRKDKGLLDKNAAAIILEDYLRENSSF